MVLWQILYQCFSQWLARRQKYLMKEGPFWYKCRWLLRSFNSKRFLVDFQNLRSTCVEPARPVSRHRAYVELWLWLQTWCNSIQFFQTLSKWVGFPPIVLFLDSFIMCHLQFVVKASSLLSIDVSHVTEIWWKHGVKDQQQISGWTSRLLAIVPFSYLFVSLIE